MEPLETSTSLAFHGVAYVVTVCVRDQTLEIQVEVDDKAASTLHETCWTAQFPANYIEDLTRKTGNYKRFPVFVNMLLSAMTHRSDAVFVDLLTTADLELYRKRKMGRQGASRPSANDSFDSDRGSTASVSQAASKRYLILTYAVEFDRVHFPLPLNLVEKPTPEILQRTIRRLRQALANATNEGPAKEMAEELRALREENRCLKATLKSYCGREPVIDGSCGGDENAGDAVNLNSGLDLKRELELSMQENKELISIYQRLREDSSSELTRLTAEIKQLKLDRDGGDRGRDLDRERAEARRRLHDSHAAALEAVAQLQDMKSQLDESQLKNKELLRQLAIARAKAGATTTPDRTAARTARAPGSTTRSTTNGTRSVGNPPSSRPQRRTSSFDPYASSEDDQDRRSNGYRSPAGGGPQRREFRRFDPTAYQQERQRKLLQRSTQRSPSPSQNTTRIRRASPSGGPPASGYASDTSAGGYSSAGSDGSRASRGSTRSRGRSRVAYQREADARLASPRKAAAAAEASFKSPGPPGSNRPPPAARGRSPSPARSTTGTSAAKSVPARRPPTPEPTRRIPNRSRNNYTPQQSVSAPQKPKPQARRLQRPPALLADTSLDSFSDIDDRLTALQQFLKEAKQGGASSISTTTTAAVTTAE